MMRVRSVGCSKRQRLGPLAVLWVSACVSSVALVRPVEMQQRDLIIHGRDADKGRYPYFVTLDHWGGGALIAPDIILTAGHCMPRKHQHLKPRVGTYSFRNDREGIDFERFEIEKMARHPDWVQVNDDEFRNDFALLKLSGQSTKQIVRMNRNNNLPRDGQAVTAMGVGDTVPDRESRSDTLQEVVLNAIPNDVCTTAVAMHRNLTYQGRIFPSHLCTTGGPKNKRDACSYDSGSPIIIRGKTAKDDLLVGLVSWGEECADPAFPGVNSRVSEVSEWIDATVCSMSDNPPSGFCPSQWHTSHMATAALTLALLVACITIFIKVLRRAKVKSLAAKEGLGKPSKRSYTKLERYDSIEGVEVTGVHG